MLRIVSANVFFSKEVGPLDQFQGRKDTKWLVNVDGPNRRALSYTT